jgi:diguanylate cyclase (GGDEF)-like protein
MGMTMPTKGSKGSARAFAVQLMEHLVVPTFVLDDQRRVIIWNRACERLTGVLAADVLGTSDQWRGFYAAPRYCLADILALGRAEELHDLYHAHTVHDDNCLGLRAEVWCVMPGVGKRLYLAIDAGPIYDEGGKLIAVVETLRDMTEQQLAQTALQSLAVKDGLTGIANRRSFDETLGAQWLRAQREQVPLSLLLADVDHFKRYNDAYGHQKGDECLKRVAATINEQTLRPGDLTARYGGEEFAMILPTTTGDAASQVAERVRKAVCALEIPHAESDVGRSR